MFTICRGQRMGLSVETPDQFCDVPCGQGPAEEIALHLLDAGMHEHGLKLLLGLNALGDDRKIQDRKSVV